MVMSASPPFPPPPPPGVSRAAFSCTDRRRRVFAFPEATRLTRSRPPSPRRHQHQARDRPHRAAEQHRRREGASRRPRSPASSRSPGQISRTFARDLGTPPSRRRRSTPSPPALTLVPAPRAHPQAVSDIIRTTLGPRSMLKMILDASGGASTARRRPPRPADRLGSRRDRRHRRVGTFSGRDGLISEPVECLFSPPPRVTCSDLSRVAPLPPHLPSSPQASSSRTTATRSSARSTSRTPRRSR